MNLEPYESAYMFLEGHKDIGKDEKKGLRAMKYLEGKGNRQANIAIFAYQYKHGSRKDAFFDLKQRVDKNKDPYGEFIISFFYFHGIKEKDGTVSVEKDITLSFKYCKLSAKRGFVSAENALGSFYLGRYKNIPFNLKKSFQYYSFALMKKNPVGFYLAGYLFEKGGDYF